MSNELPRLIESCKNGPRLRGNVALGFELELDIVLLAGLTFLDLGAGLGLVTVEIE